MWAARSLDQTALRPSCHQKNPSNNVKYITHMQIVIAGVGVMKWKRGDIVKNNMGSVRSKNGTVVLRNDI